MCRFLDYMLCSSTASRSTTSGKTTGPCGKKYLNRKTISRHLIISAHKRPIVKYLIIGYQQNQVSKSNVGYGHLKSVVLVWKF